MFTVSINPIAGPLSEFQSYEKMVKTKLSKTSFTNTHIGVVYCVRKHIDFIINIYKDIFKDYDTTNNVCTGFSSNSKHKFTEHEYDLIRNMFMNFSELPASITKDEIEFINKGIHITFIYSPIYTGRPLLLNIDISPIL